MTRGNQRELARAKNLKKEAKSKGGNGKSGSELAKQGLSDAEKMRQKQLEGANNQTYSMPTTNQSTDESNSQ
ncbi:hypothetical protein V8C40DRAFT_237762 [Trichoderma camerunense]